MGARVENPKLNFVKKTTNDNYDQVAADDQQLLEKGWREENLKLILPYPPNQTKAQPSRGKLLMDEVIQNNFEEIIKRNN